MTSKQLKFCHIPKNAGSTITANAAKHGLQWGINSPENRRWFRRIPKSEWTHLDHCDWHHTPLSFMDMRELEIVLARYDFFAVVRDPYAKAVSECNWSTVMGLVEGPQTKSGFNQFIRHRLSQKPDREHWAPQVNFIYDVNGRQVIKHVLRYENLAAEFDTLMALYNLPVKLDNSHNVSPKHFSVEDLEPDTIVAINNFYHYDFIKLGYTMKTV